MKLEKRISLFIRNIRDFIFPKRFSEGLYKLEDKRPTKIIDTDGLRFRRTEGGCENYNGLKRTYIRNELSSFIDGRKVKYWKWVYSAFDFENDEFIPIFYKQNRIRKRRTR